MLAANRRFDLIFLDIQMDGVNGIETAKAVREYDRKAVIIFVTAVREYVFEAFDVGAFHYLLKPLGEQKFAEVFENAVREIRERRIQRETPALFIRTKNKSYTLNQSEIIFIESRNRKAAIHTTGNTLEVYAVMKELQKELGNSFYRCHRGYLVNMAHITEYSSDMIEMDNGERVYLAKEKYQEFVKTYMRYLRNGGAAYAKGKMFFLEMENSFDGKVVRKRDAEFPITTKADKKVHGIGPMNIKNTAEKYHGAVDWSIQHKVFTLSVMLKNEKGM